MVKCFVKLSGILLSVVLLVSCSLTNSKPFLIDFSADHKSVVFSNIDPAGLLWLKNSPVQDSIFKSLISVSQIASDEDSVSKEVSMKGTVVIEENKVVFKPNEPFVKGRSYLVNTYLNTQFYSTEKMLKGQMNYNLKPTQKMLSN